MLVQNFPHQQVKKSKIRREGTLMGKYNCINNEGLVTKMELGVSFQNLEGFQQQTELMS